MKTFTRILVLAALAFALAACNAFIPDQPIDNAFGLDGVPLELTSSQAASRMEAQAASLRFEAQISTSLDDIDTSSIPGWVDPATLSEKLGLEREVRLVPGLSGSCPNDFTITAAELEFTVTDPDGASISKRFDASGLDLGFTRTSEGAFECRYEATPATADVFLMTLLLAGRDLDILYRDIFANGQAPNEVSGRVALSLESDEPFAADALRVVLASSDGVMTF